MSALLAQRPSRAAVPSPPLRAVLLPVTSLLLGLPAFVFAFLHFVGPPSVFLSRMSFWAVVFALGILFLSLLLFLDRRSTPA